ncbi:hypothetical protein [Providencia sp. Me31A]|uniref:hypothetical protein n=1 Tax=Providencia sp. Me31A TaxID=3392637 RepID=UPI003D2A07D4
MNKVIFTLSFVFFTTSLAHAQSPIDMHKNAASALTFTENNSSPSTQQAIKKHLNQAGIDTKTNIAPGKSFSQLSSEEKRAVSLSFTQNNTSPTIQKMTQDSLKHSEENNEYHTKSITSFSDMNEHEIAIITLNSHKNSASEPIQNEIKKHSKITK